MEYFFIKDTLALIHWDSMFDSMNTKGYSLLGKILPETLVQEWVLDYNQENLYRKTILMERYRFGLGEYKYFADPLPPTIQGLREGLYAYLSPWANTWMKQLGLERVYPPAHFDFIQECHASGQLLPTPLILKYGLGGHNTLHQDLYGGVYFPFQAVCFLTEPELDYTGGEFVLTQQIPRAQSKAIVLKPRKGDILLFPSQYRPIKGNKGYYRVNIKHGVSEVHSGNRLTLGIIFHDGLH